jgi:hypothetical protein
VFFTASPDGREAVFAVPATSASLWTNNPAIAQMVQQINHHPYLSKVQTCDLEQPQPLAQKISALAQAMGQKIGFKSTEATGAMQAMPGDAPARLAATVQQANQQLANQGMQLSAEMGRLPVRVTTANGESFDGYVNVLQRVRTQRMPNGGTIWLTDYPMQVLTAAPAGKYADYESMFAAMLDTVQVNPEFEQVMAKVGANSRSIRDQMMADNARAAMQQAQIRQDVNNYARNVISSVNAHRAAAFEHSNQQFSLYMGDQAQYHDPATGGTVQLPSGYNHVWSSQTGNTSEYILSDSASYNPNGQVGNSSWTEMQMVR